MRTTVLILCLVGISTAIRAGDPDAERLEKLRARLSSYQATPAPDWIRKGAFIVPDPAGELYRAVGVFSLSTPVAKESSYNRLFAAMMTAESRARAELAKSVSARVTQTETKASGQEERSTKVQSTATLSAVQILEYYLADDGKTLYALAQWRNDPEAQKAVDKLNDQVRSYAQKNAARASGAPDQAPRAHPAPPARDDDLSACSKPWEPSAADFDARVAAVRPCFSGGDVDMSWGNAPRPWIKRKRWSQGKGREKVYFAVGVAQLRNAADPEESLRAWQRARLNTARRLPRNRWLGNRIVDLHYDGKKVWVLVGSSARPKD